MEDFTPTHIDDKAPESPEDERPQVTLAYTLKNPVKAAMAHDAKTMLGEGCSIAQISRETGLDRRTIHKIQEVFADEIGTTFKKHAVSRCDNIAHLSMDALETSIQEHIDGTGKAIPAGTLSLITCQLLDKRQLLAGEATTRTENTHKPSDFISVDELYSSLKAKDAKDNAIDVTPGT